MTVSDLVSFDLFESVRESGIGREELGPGAVLFRGLALPREGDLLIGLREAVARAPFRHMLTPGGYRMSVAITNCGSFGWITDKSGYRYDPVDPESGRSWPELPDAFGELAADAAKRAGFAGFVPDACLINRYQPGARLSLHQDKNESDFSHPIVSVSLGLPAVFLFGGLARSDKPSRIRLTHGDVVVWGGPARLRYHGIMPLRGGHHPLLGECRINLTLRRAGQ